MWWPRRRKDDRDDTALLKKIDERSSNVVHVTHNDLDAVGADAVHRICHGKILTFYCSIGFFPRVLDILGGTPGRGDTISISDLGFQKANERSLRKAKAAGWRIEWRDHHRWNESETSLVREIIDHLTVNTHTCACGICREELLPDNPLAQEIAHVVCDYDLWHHKDPRSKVLGLVLQRQRNRDHVRDCLMQGIFSDPGIEAEYASITDEMNRAMRRSLNHTVLRGARYKVAFAPGYGYPSETAAFLREELGTAIEVIISPSWRFSIRSVPPISHLIAREFGGGGHPNAAGGTFHFTLLEKLRYLILRDSADFNRFVAISEEL
jgi:oligoribonuclease NrnB/cAMP/cGMP phosphodiesterase (DHH superfamily)